MLSGELATDTGTDVEISSGVSRGRSLMVIGVAIAAIAGAATFSGKGSTSAAPTTAAASTTTATAQGSSTSTTSTSVPLPETTLRNALTTDGDSNATAPTAPPVPLVQTVSTPILPEKSGLKLLVVGLGPPIDGRRVDAIVDLDSGVVTRTIATFRSNGNDNSVTVQQHRSGVVVSDFNTGTITAVKVDGTRRSTSVRLFQPNSVITGDIYWTSLFSGQSTSSSAALVGIDLISGEEVARIDLPQNVGLVGTTSDGKPVVVEYGTGTYAVDIETQSFTLITPQSLTAIDRGNRLERRCDASLHCRSIVQFANGAVIDIPPIDPQNEPRVELAPSGDRALLRTFNNGDTELSVLDFKTGERLSLGSDNASQNPFTTFSWSTDGQWLFGVRSGALIAWKVGWATPITLTFDGAPVSAAAVAIFPTVV